MSPMESLAQRLGVAEPTEPLVAPEPALTPHQAALVAEACTRSSVVWVRPGGEDRWHAAWHAWHEDAVHVVFGVGEQMLPLLSERVEVAARSKEAGTRLVTFAAWAELLQAGTERWEAAAAALSAKRLNDPDPAGQRDRWASGCLLVRLAPLSLVVEGPGGDATPSGAIAPPGGDGTTGGHRPFHLRGRRRRWRRWQG